MRPGDLAAREGVTAPTMTRIVASPQDAGLVDRAAIRRTGGPCSSP